MSKEETIEVTVKLPKKLVEFLRAMEKNLDMTMEQYIQRNIVDVVYADLDSMEVFLPPIVPTRIEFVEKYGLAEVFKQYNFEIPKYWSDC